MEHDTFYRHKILTFHRCVRPQHPYAGCWWIMTLRDTAASSLLLLEFAFVRVSLYRSLVLMDPGRLTIDGGGGRFSYSILLMHFAFVGVSF